MNKELLTNLYSIHSPSGGERKIKRFIKKYIADNIPGCNVYSKEKQLYVIKGESETYPCVVAHLDQVQKNHSSDFDVIEYNDAMIGFSLSSKNQQGLGADDKNGIWVALECLKHFDNIKIAFFTEEEIGCIGSDKADISFFDDCRFILQADRKGSSDFITTASCTDLCSDEFRDAVLALGHGYKENHGMMTDVLTLKEKGINVSCANFSCGYYNAHTDSEITILSELDNCRQLFFDIIENLTDVYPHKYIDIFSGKNYKYDYHDWYDYDWRNYQAPKSTKAKATKVSIQAYNDTYDDAFSFLCDVQDLGITPDWYSKDVLKNEFTQNYAYDFDDRAFDDAYNDFMYYSDNDKGKDMQVI